MPTKVFFVVPTNPPLHRVWLRRYNGDAPCPAMDGSLSYHDARTFIGDFPEGEHQLNPPHDDPRWPTHCACGYAFQDEDEWQPFPRLLYERYDKQPGRWTLMSDDLPSGGMWNARWYPSMPAGPDGISLIVRLPNKHDWHVDGRANNCTRPTDTVHRCWVRHGDPRTGDVHVDKNGDTCQAGAGSILAGNYHGFLHHGYLTD